VTAIKPNKAASGCEYGLFAFAGVDRDHFVRQAGLLQHHSNLRQAGCRAEIETDYAFSPFVLMDLPDPAASITPAGRRQMLLQSRRQRLPVAGRRETQFDVDAGAGAVQFDAALHAGGLQIAAQQGIDVAAERGFEKSEFRHQGTM